MKAITNLIDLMVEQLRDLYNAEKQLIEALPEGIKHADDPELKEILTDYINSNEEQLLRIRQSFEVLFAQKRGENCEAMAAMILEMNDLIKRSTEPIVRDAGLVTAIQHIIHYKMAGYGAICTYAQMLDFEEIASTIHLNLEVEKKTDDLLIRMAEGKINQRAAMQVH